MKKVLFLVLLSVCLSLFAGCALQKQEPAKLDAIPGTVPSPGDLPQGCPFRPRCPEAHERCFKTPPVIESAGADGAREVCCWLAEAR